MTFLRRVCGAIRHHILGRKTIGSMVSAAAICRWLSLNDCSCLDPLQKNAQKGPPQRKGADAYSPSTSGPVRGEPSQKCSPKCKHWFLIHMQIYDGPRPEWLRDVLEQLPNLQSLIVARLPFFDHMALLALRSYSTGRRPSLGGACPTFTLRLLIATHCQNTTSQGLVGALEHFPNLAFLDLSETLAARDKTVLCKLRGLQLLQVLKLRNVHLRDEDTVQLAEAIGIRVRSLDVRGNHLTDHSVRTLLGACFDIASATSETAGGRPRASSNLAIDDWPSGYVRPDPAVMDEFKDESYDERFVRRLTTQVVSRLPFEDLPNSGITHLFIADNDLSVEGLAALIRSKRLHILDAGSINPTRMFKRPRSQSSSSPGMDYCDQFRLPGVEKLTPVLGRCAQSMTSLRLDHSIITQDAPPQEDILPLAVCELSVEDPTPEMEADVPVAHEMDAIPPLYELHSHEAEPRYELAGDAMHFIVSPAMGKKPEAPEPDEPEVRRGSIFAPEVAEEQEDLDNEAQPVVLTATGLGSMAQAVNGVNSLNQTLSAEPGTSFSEGKNGDISLSISLITEQRNELRSQQKSKIHGLTPGMLPNLRTITLTNVPSHDSARKSVDALLQFIKYCAAEAELARLQARLQPQALRAPGLPSSKNHRQSAREIFALQRIVLELAPTVPLPSSNLSPDILKHPRLLNRTTSSTEDADTEALWSASENDFTFFDDDEECGLPAAETGTQPSFVAVSDKIVMPPDGAQPEDLPILQHPARNEAPVDVVQELAKFRRERKAAYENAVKMGVRHVDGHWPGEVKVVRAHGLRGKLDYYGNYFDKGVYR